MKHGAVSPQHAQLPPGRGRPLGRCWYIAGQQKWEMVLTHCKQSLLRKQISARIIATAPDPTGTARSRGGLGGAAGRRRFGRPQRSKRQLESAWTVSQTSYSVSQPSSRRADRGPRGGQSSSEPCVSFTSRQDDREVRVARAGFGGWVGGWVQLWRGSSSWQA